jgi:hypothetical protein
MAIAKVSEISAASLEPLIAGHAGLTPSPRPSPASPAHHSTL